MILGICVHNAHVVNTVSLILSEVRNQEVSILLRGLWQLRVVQDGFACGPGHLCLQPLHGATCKYEGVVTDVRGGKFFAGQVCDPIPDIVMKRRDETTPLTIEGVAN